MGGCLMKPRSASSSAYVINKALFYISLLVLSFIFVAVFCFFTNPLTSYLGGDASFFQLVGQGMTKGMLPYRDFFDMKGIYLFLIEYLSQLICYGRTGCYLMEVVNFFLILVIVDKLHLVSKPDLKPALRYLCLLPYLWVMAVTFEGGNLTEEFSLPFVLICVLLCEKYRSRGDESMHPPLYGAVYGFCFGVIAFIRITNAAVICAIVLAVFINLLIQKKYLCIFKNGIGFIAGLVLSVLPGILYCFCKGILPEMLRQVFSFGFTYASEGKMIDFFFFHDHFFIYLFLALFPILAMYIYKDSNRFLKIFVFAGFAASVIALSMGNAYEHYFTMLIPNLAVGINIVLSHMEPKNEKAIKKCAIYLCCVLLALSPWLFIAGGKGLLSFVKDHHDYDAKNIAAMIPENDKNSVYTYDIPSRWYLETGLFPCIRYCDWQNHYIELSEDVKADLNRILLETPPRWIVTRSPEEKAELPDFVKDDLSKNYSLYSDNSSYCLWQFLS